MKALRHSVFRTLLPLCSGVLLALPGCSREEEPERAFPKGLGGPPPVAQGAPLEAPPPPDDATRPGSPPAAPTVPPGAAQAPAPVPPHPDTGWVTGVKEASGSDRVATQSGARAARNAGFDRVVLDFGTDALPGWRIEYVDEPVRQCGSGEAVALPGAGWLAIRLIPAQAHDEAGTATVAERALRPGLPNLLELRLTCDFEAHVEWVAAVRSPQPYRVFRLREPNRLVIDIRQPR